VGIGVSRILVDDRTEVNLPATDPWICVSVALKSVKKWRLAERWRCKVRATAAACLEHGPSGTWPMATRQDRLDYLTGNPSQPRQRSLLDAAAWGLEVWPKRALVVLAAGRLAGIRGLTGT
jgi:hypothetical protein